MLGSYEAGKLGGYEAGKLGGLKAKGSRKKAKGKRRRHRAQGLKAWRFGGWEAVRPKDKNFDRWVNRKIGYKAK